MSATASIPFRFETPTMRKVSGPSEYPQGKCFVIQFYGTETIGSSGNEKFRSEEWTRKVEVVTTFATKSEVEWKTAIKTLMRVQPDRKDFVAFVSQRAALETSVEVSIAT